MIGLGQTAKKVVIEKSQLKASRTSKNIHGFNIIHPS